MHDFGTVLGVWAHPDDETYLMAGIMAATNERGGRVACITATRGEAGSQDEVRWPSEKIAQIREAELMDALALLGVREHYWLDYIDGRCSEVDEAESVAKIANLITSIEPRSVFTFPPDGHTGHPDHVAVSKWTSAAFEIADVPGSRLYWHRVEQTWADRWLPELEPYNVFESGLPAPVDENELAIRFELSDELVDRKIAALKAQVSQTEGFMGAIGENFFRVALAEETFVLAAERT